MKFMNGKELSLCLDAGRRRRYDLLCGGGRLTIEMETLSLSRRRTPTEIYRAADEDYEWK